MRRALLSRSFLLVLLAFLLPGSALASSLTERSAMRIDRDDAEDCQEFVPAEMSVSGVTDDGSNVLLEVSVLLDWAEGVQVAQLRRQADAAEAAGNTTQAADLRAQADSKFNGMVDEAKTLLEAAKTSYAPLDITLRFVAFDLLDPLKADGTPRVRTTDATTLNQLAKAHFGGQRPGGADLVYTLVDFDMTDPVLGNGVAGLADCIGGVRYPNRAFAVGEISDDIPIGPLTFYYQATAKIAAHELGHLMGAHHHYQDCVEGIPTELEAGEPSPCTLMTNFVDFQSLNFSVVEGAAVRGHAFTYAK